MLASRLFPPLEDAYNPSERNREEKKEVKKKEKSGEMIVFIFWDEFRAHTKASLSISIHPVESKRPESRLPALH